MNNELTARYRTVDGLQIRYADIGGSASQQLVLDSGHLAWEEASREYGAIIAAWINGGYLTVSAGMGRI